MLLLILGILLWCAGHLWKRLAPDARAGAGDKGKLIAAAVIGAGLLLMILGYRGAAFVPVWTPPAEMIARQPELEPFRNGMPPGLTNPLGARALYIFEGNRDTIYRIHGSAEYWTIGTAVSSGCVRLINQDVIDLYNRVPNGTRIVVIQGPQA